MLSFGNGGVDVRNVFGVCDENKTKCGESAGGGCRVVRCIIDVRGNG